jgi:hypothetical protein
LPRKKETDSPRNRMSPQERGYRTVHLRPEVGDAVEAYKKKIGAVTLSDAIGQAIKKAEEKS